MSLIHIKHCVFTSLAVIVFSMHPYSARADRQFTFKRCVEYYVEDIVLGETILKINRAYVAPYRELKELKSDACQRGYGHSGWGGCGKFSKPFEERMTRLVNKKNGAIEKVRYEREKLAYKYAECAQ